MNRQQKIIAIVGPTSSGKSDLAVQLAKQIGGEVISADSRQVYRGLDIGSGKVTKKEMAGIRHHLLDVARPSAVFTADDFKRQAKKAIEDISKRGKIPIIAGGTGFWFETLLATESLPPVPPDKKLRVQLAKQETMELFAELKKLDPIRAKAIDCHNRPRLIRAIEICRQLGTVPRKKTNRRQYDVLWLGLLVPKEILAQKIKDRLKRRLARGLIAEVRRLQAQGVSWRRLYDLGLEYRYVSLHLRGQLSKEKMTVTLEQAIIKYAKRQMTWFKREKQINWLNQFKQADLLVTDWLND
ncbi:MAG: tRNA (adenosine(37)-N6)-dimethylallyltransferase MiaA [Candidatus Paceibacterota bacterium]